MIELYFIQRGALPPNKGMQRTSLTVTPIAYAMAVPLSQAADARS